MLLAITILKASSNSAALLCTALFEVDSSSSTSQLSLRHWLSFLPFSLEWQLVDEIQKASVINPARPNDSCLATEAKLHASVRHSLQMNKRILTHRITCYTDLKKTILWRTRIKPNQALKNNFRIRKRFIMWSEALKHVFNNV